MKTLKNHTMVYDADCPLCSAYTRTFVTAGMLDEQGRIPYQQVGGSFCPGMDEERSKNEIALVNRDDGTVHYGLDSLLTILEFRFRWMRIARVQPLKFFLQKLYNFISYNRKVIIPARGVTSGVRSPDLTHVHHDQVRYDCTPTFKLKYRLAYIIVAWIFTSVTLVSYSKLLGDLIPATNFYREFLICGGQVLFQSLTVGVFLLERRALSSFGVKSRAEENKKLMDYLGNMMTVSLFGAVLLLPGLLIGNLFPAISPVVWMLYFMSVVGVMLFEHARRMKLVGLGWWPSVSWVIYRIIVLLVIVI